MRGANLLSTLDALDRRIEGPLHEAFDVACGTSIGEPVRYSRPIRKYSRAMPQGHVRHGRCRVREGVRLAAFGERSDDGSIVLTEVVTERIGASQDLRAPVVEPPPPPPKTKKQRRVRRFLARVVLRRRQEVEPPPKLAGRKPLAFAVAAREAETGSLEPFLFRTYPREQHRAGRSDVSGRPSRQPAPRRPSLRPSRLMGRVMWMVGWWPMIRPPRSRRGRVGVSRQARRGRGFTRMRSNQEGAPGGAAGRKKVVPEA